MGLKFEPDDYRLEPELWLANQSGHMALGAAAAVLICAVWFIIAGEFPYRSVVFAALAAVYVLRVELIGQGNQGWDTIEDVTFVVGYGAAPVLFAFHEVRPGSSEFTGDVLHVAPFLAVACLHLALGALWRVRKRKKASRVENEGTKE